MFRAGGNCSPHIYGEPQVGDHGFKTLNRDRARFHRPPNPQTSSEPFSAHRSSFRLGPVGLAEELGTLKRLSLGGSVRENEAELRPGLAVPHLATTVSMHPKEKAGEAH